MPRKITVTFAGQFTHGGDTYARYRREDNGCCTDIKVRHRDGAVIYGPAQAQAEAARRLRSGRRWAHPHLVR
jgi:hypothetical protein